VDGLRLPVHLDLLTADYTFVDERLAKHYGIPYVTPGNYKVTVQVTGFKVPTDAMKSTKSAVFIRWPGLKYLPVFLPLPAACRTAAVIPIRTCNILRAVSCEVACVCRNVILPLELQASIKSRRSKR
jgi:hypothetical protein